MNRIRSTAGFVLTLISLFACAEIPQPTTTQVQGVVSNIAEVGLEGVNVKVVGGSTQANTDARGRVNLALEPEKTLTLKLSKSSFADQFKVVKFSTGSKTALFDARMIAREAAITVSNVENGATITGKNGTQVILPAGALVNEAGQAVTGDIQVNLSPVNVLNQDIAGFPGLFEGIDQTGTRTNIVSYGTAEFSLSQNGQKVQLAPGKTAQIEIPQYATKNPDGSSVVVGQKIPLWYLDETTGVWKQEGEGEVVKSSSSSGLAFRATVSHFSWWNCDLGIPSGSVRLRCIGADGQFMLDSDCEVYGGSVLTNAAQALAGGSVRPGGFSDSLRVPANQNMYFRGCALVITPEGQRGRACGVTTVLVGVQQSVDASIQLKLENNWTGRISGDLSAVANATLSFVGSSITGTAKAFNVTWKVNGTLNPDDSISLGFAAGNVASVEFTGNINALRTQITGTWNAKTGPSAGKKGQFFLSIVEE
jgi:hypothetical protein